MSVRYLRDGSRNSGNVRLIVRVNVPVKRMSHIILSLFSPSSQRLAKLKVTHN